MIAKESFKAMRHVAKFKTQRAELKVVFLSGWSPYEGGHNHSLTVS